MLLPDAESYDELAAEFAWKIPERFNIGAAVCDDWAEREPEREALVYVEEGGDTARYSYADLRRLSNQLANLLVSRDVKPLKAPEGPPHDLGQYYLLIDPEASGDFFARLAQVAAVVALDEGARMPGQGKNEADPVTLEDAVWAQTRELAGA